MSAMFCICVSEAVGWQSTFQVLDIFRSRYSLIKAKQSNGSKVMQRRLGPRPSERSLYYAVAICLECDNSKPNYAKQRRCVEK